MTQKLCSRLIGRLIAKYTQRKLCVYSHVSSANLGKYHTLMIANNSFENVAKFKHLQITITKLHS